MSDTEARFLLEPEAAERLAGYGIPYPSHVLARTPDEAAEAAEKLGFPVVLKIVSPDVVHKNDVGGVMVGLGDAEAVREGFAAMERNVAARVPGADIRGCLVLTQAAAGVEVIIGGLNDPVFGPTVMFGLGGIFTEILDDVSFRIAPFEMRHARAMIREIKGYPVLAGARGGPAADEDALARAIVDVGRLMADHPDIRELDLNPVRVFEQGLLALDARIRREAEANP